MIVSIDLSQEIFAIDMLRALKSSLKHRRKHVLRPLQLYGDQALGVYVNDGGNVVRQQHQMLKAVTDSKLLILNVNI